MMKKKHLLNIFFALFAFVVISIAMAIALRSAKDTAELNKDCITLPDSSFGSRRSLGLIVKNRTVLAIKLTSESNFSPPGGHIDGSEIPEQALSRELGEELGIKTKQENFRLYKQFCEKLTRSSLQRTHLYFVDSWDGELSPKTSDRVKWVSYEYINNNKADTELQKALEYLKADNLID